jgi:ribose/xylose/arabinose/galactoside ABC-type transport system permease subunit
VVVAVFVALTASRGTLGRFLNVDALHVMVHGNTIVAVAALGMMMIIVSGGIDLSVGSVVALVTVVTMSVYCVVLAGPRSLPLLDPWARGVGWAWAGTGSMELASVAAVAAGMLTAVLCGLTNGVIITAFRLPPFVATLGMMTIARGLAFALADKKVVSFPEGGRPGWVDVLERSIPNPRGVVAWLNMEQWAPAWLTDAVTVVVRYAGFYPGFWLLLVLAAGVAVLMHRTVLGRWAYAVGSNEATARLCGIPVGLTRVTVYVLAGALTGVAGLLSFAHLGIGDPNGNVGLELSVIAVVVIGGARLMGGQGTVSGTLVGVLILGVLGSGVSACEVSADVQKILIGVIIISMMVLGQLRPLDHLRGVLGAVRAWRR